MTIIEALICCLSTSVLLRGQSFAVATVGDSFADSLYNSMRARPDLVQRSGIKLMRWSRPIMGLTRSDYFDYTGWLRDSPDLGVADLCFVEIGSNDMQSIRVSNEWIAYGSPRWKQAYAHTTLEMARILAGRRCGQVLWVLQPGFERQDALACHRELINELQREVRIVDRTRVLEIATSETSYGRDKTHFNREFLLQLGPAMFQLLDGARQIEHDRCLLCHRSVEPPTANIFPLSWPRTEPAAHVWEPNRTGTECRIAVVKRAKARRHAKHRA
jgi:hypothetical protein